MHVPYSKVCPSICTSVVHPSYRHQRIRYRYTTTQTMQNIHRCPFISYICNVHGMTVIHDESPRPYSLSQSTPSPASPHWYQLLLLVSPFMLFLVMLLFVLLLLCTVLPFGISCCLCCWCCCDVCCCWCLWCCGCCGCRCCFFWFVLLLIVLLW